MPSFTKQIRVVFDTNIWVSALRMRGNPYRSVLLAALGVVISVTCAELLDELRRVLTHKFKFPPELVERHVAAIQDFSELVVISGQLKVVAEDPEDDKVIECAVVGNADYIVTGDKHLLALRQYGNIAIVKASEFLKIFQAYRD
ncbi:MAG: putative toxin-antitoxin system toxin component, PIN family [Armatimonadetes bacterium]|nr:putative toxin-antitoxin system toxin component, PIN family [Armatimonadota bacterium]